MPPLLLQGWDPGSRDHRLTQAHTAVCAWPEVRGGLLDSKALFSVHCRVELVIKKNTDAAHEVGSRSSQEVCKGGGRDTVVAMPASEVCWSGWHHSPTEALQLGLPPISGCHCLE